MDTYIIIYYLFINTLLFILFAIDKNKARKKKYRISEATLITLGLLGGCIGGLAGMKTFRHKTKKPKFKAAYALALIGHAIVIYLITSKI